MTSGLLIETFDQEKVIMIQDYQLTIYDAEDTIKETGTKSKILYGDGWVLASAGSYKEPGWGLFRKFLRGETNKQVQKAFGSKNTAEKAIKYAARFKNFPEVQELNYLGSDEETTSDDHYIFLLTSYFGSTPYMAKVNALGKVFSEKADTSPRYLTLGSGAEKLDQFLDSRIGETIDPAVMDDIVTLDIAVKAIMFASRDLECGGDPRTETGFDYATLTRSKTKYYGDTFAEFIKEKSKEFREKNL